MRVLIVTPAPRGSRRGNRVTARRWALMLRRLGHRVAIADAFTDQTCDLMVALHAEKSAGAIARYRERLPEAPLVLALTGTDLYGAIRTSEAARRSLEAADRLVVLQPLAIDELPDALRAKARVIYQSACAPTGPRAPDPDAFEVCVVGHLRAVKDPFRAAEAAGRLPDDSRVRVVSIGAALSDDMAERARAEMEHNPRYRWLGERPRRQTLLLLARSRLLALTSEMEGGANAISEAVACGVPVVSSEIAGSIGLLGADYPGYFPAGDTDALAKLLRRAELDRPFYEELSDRCARVAPLFDPARECRAWADLISELAGGAAA